MVIAKKDYDRYIALASDAEKIQKEVLEPRVREIIKALFREDRIHHIHFSADHVSCEGMYDMGIILKGKKFDLLFDEEWEIKVQEILEEEKRIIDKRGAESARMEKERTEKKEKEELTRLMAKYPDMAQ